MKNLKQLGKSLGLGVGVLFTLVVFAYGFRVTQVNLAETRSERRQVQLVRILRALAHPDIIEYGQQEFIVESPIWVPCPAKGLTPSTPDTAKPYFTVTPPCADPGATITVEGFNFEPGTQGPLNFIPPSEVKLTLGTIQVGSDGHFTLQVKLPKRPEEQVQNLQAITRRNIGTPMLSKNALDTWDKIVETVFLALLATTFGLIFSIPLSFLAARNLMKEITSPLLSVALSLLALPIGFLMGVYVARWCGQLSGFLTKNIWVELVGVVVTFFVVRYGIRLALPEVEETQPTLKKRIQRGLILCATIFIGIVGLFLTASLLGQLGKNAASVLGAFSFMGTFFSDVGDILGMILNAAIALAGAGILSSFAGKLGEKLVRKLSIPVSRMICILFSAAAGAEVCILIMAGINWFYEINNPLIVLVYPAVIGALLGILVSLRLKPKDPLPVGMVIYYVTRTIFNALRSIEALIMAIVFVVWVGIGPFAGVLALSLHTVAALSKLYSEQVESILAGPVEAVKATGANRLQTIVYAVIPQIIPPYISFTMYRWDINVRMSTIIGFAGGGGIGFLLISNINLLNYHAASTQMLAIAIVVAAMDYLSSKLREKAV